MALKRICSKSLFNSITRRSFHHKASRSQLQFVSNSNNLFAQHQNKRFCSTINANHTEQIERIQSDSSVDTSQLNLSEFNETELSSIEKAAASIPQDGVPRLLVSWICANCGTRCAKHCRKESYYKTLVIMRCDDCRKWQLMSDHLHWFKDDMFEIEKLLEQSDQDPDPQIREKIVNIINTVAKREAEKSESSE
eukprot:100911_1